MPRDLYDVLEVSRDANSDELRLAYRKLALVWHPDKNATRQEEATVRFKEIQNAYEVLSDKNERAWYDSHREEILRGGSTHYAGADTGAPPAEEGINLWAYFSTSAFSGYGDSGLGFYGVYGKVFEEIAKNEMQVRRMLASPCRLAGKLRVLSKLHRLAMLATCASSHL
jgi:DnaJ family protein A protein 5